jgi:hypothetical protein
LDAALAVAPTVPERGDAAQTVRCRAMVATADPGTLPGKATWYLVTCLPRPGGWALRAVRLAHPVDHAAAPVDRMAERASPGSRKPS